MKLFFYFLLSFICISTFPNNSRFVAGSSKYIPTMFTPQSPQIYEFNKVTRLPVNKYNGQACVSIPIYSVDIKGFSLPIELVYSTGGIKVNEKPSWVGLGWNFSIGGIIQITNGADDFDKNYLHSNVSFSPSTMNSIHTHQQTKPPTIAKIDINDNSTNLDPKAYGFLRIECDINGFASWNVNSFMDVRDEQEKTDYERDIFIVNLFGENIYIYSYIPEGETVTSVKEFRVMNKKGYKINYEKDCWKIITPDGVICYFNQMTLNTTNYFSGYNDIEKLINMDDKLTYTSYNSSYYRQWYPTKFISPQGDSIIINYYDKVNSLNKNSSYELMIGNFDKYYQYAHFSPMGGWSRPLSTEAEIPIFASNSTVKCVKTSAEEEVCYIKEILFNGNIIDFSLSPRLDFKELKKIDKISIGNITGNIVRKIKFSYDYFESEIISSTSSSKRLKLVSIVDNDQKYLFGYDSINLPPYGSYAVDYWGYYNGHNDNKTPLPHIKDLNVDYENKTLTDKICDQYAGNLLSDEKFSKAASLNMITYPTGGKQIFHFGLNEYLNNTFVREFRSDLITKKYGNGLRLDSVITYLEDGTKNDVIKYEYKGGKLLLPLYNSYAKTYYYYRTWPLSQNQGTFAADQYSGRLQSILSNNSFNTANSLGVSSIVGYDNVSEIFTEPKNNQIIGKEISYFINQQAFFDDRNAGSNFPEVIKAGAPYHKGFANGTIVKTETLDTENNLKKRIINQYKILKPQNILYNTCVQSRLCYYGTSPDINKENRWVAQLIYYPIYITSTYQTESSIEEFFKQDTLQSKVTYSYDDNMIIYEKQKKNIFDWIVEIEQNITPKKMLDKYIYYDYDKSIITRLLDRNILSVALIQRKMVVNKGNVSEQERKDYYNNYNTIDSTIYSHNNTETQIIRYKYNLAGNLIEVINPEYATTYIWGYNNQYIIAKIENATVYDVENILGTNLDALSMKINPNMDLLNSLRYNTQLKNSAIYTYEYYPLIGITKITNPRGVSVNYNYKKNKLSKITDMNGSILYEYNYNLTR